MWKSTTFLHIALLRFLAMNHFNCLTAVDMVKYKVHAVKGIITIMIVMSVWLYIKMMNKNTHAIVVRLKKQHHNVIVVVVVWNWLSGVVKISLKSWIAVNNIHVWVNFGCRFFYDIVFISSFVIFLEFSRTVGDFKRHRTQTFVQF